MKQRRAAQVEVELRKCRADLKKRSDLEAEARRAEEGLRSATVERDALREALDRASEERDALRVEGTRRASEAEEGMDALRVELASVRSTHDAEMCAIQRVVNDSVVERDRRLEERDRTIAALEEESSNH